MLLTQSSRAGLYYPCDEFPPATWIEIGGGCEGKTPANTFCAGQTCINPQAKLETNEVGKAEQDWQGQSHECLREILLVLAEQRNNKYTWHNIKNPNMDRALSALQALGTEADGLAAVVVVADKKTGVDRGRFHIEQARRRDEGSSATKPRSRLGPSFEEAYKRMRAGHGRRFEIRANVDEASATYPAESRHDERVADRPLIRARR